MTTPPTPDRLREIMLGSFRPDNLFAIALEKHLRELIAAELRQEAKEIATMINTETVQVEWFPCIEYFVKRILARALPDEETP